MKYEHFMQLPNHIKFKIWMRGKKHDSKTVQDIFNVSPVTIWRWSCKSGCVPRDVLAIIEEDAKELSIIED